MVNTSSRIIFSFTAQIKHSWLLLFHLNYCNIFHNFSCLLFILLFVHCYCSVIIVAVLCVQVNNDSNNNRTHFEYTSNQNDTCTCNNKGSTCTCKLALQTRSSILSISFRAESSMVRCNSLFQFCSSSGTGTGCSTDVLSLHEFSINSKYTAVDKNTQNRELMNATWIDSIIKILN